MTITDALVQVGAAFGAACSVGLIANILSSEFKRTHGARRSRTRRIRIARKPQSSVKPSARQPIATAENSHKVPVFDPETRAFLGFVQVWNHDGSAVHKPDKKNFNSEDRS